MKLLNAGIIIFCYLYCLPLANSASWPLFRGTAARTGVLVEQARPPLTPKWNFKNHGGFVSSPVVYNGIVYCGGRDFNIWAWDAYTGQQKWNFSCSGWVDATPLVTSSTVFVPCRDKNVYALDSRTGQLKWQTYTGSADCSSPVMYKDSIYFLSGFPLKSVYCVNADNGNITKTIPVSQSGFSSPAINNNLMFLGTNDGQFLCIDLAAGKINWSKPTQGGIFYSTFAADDNYVYAVSGGDDRRLYCFNHEGTPVWRSAEFNDNTTQVSSIALDQDKVMVATTFVSTSTLNTELRLLAFDHLGADSPDPYSNPFSEPPLWSTTIGQPHPSGIISSPSCADGVVYIGSGDGWLYCINSADGQYIAPGTGSLTPNPTGYYLCFDNSASTGIVSSPCISNGYVYVGTYDGNFWAFQAQKSAYISSPDNSALVVNTASIQGAINTTGSSPYQLEYGKGANPSSWTPILLATTTAQGQISAQWDTTFTPDGIYSLRLTAQGDSTQRAVNTFSVNNSPPAPSNLSVADTPFDGGGSLTLNWRASADDGAGNNDVVGYNVYKSTFSGGYALLKHLPKATTSFIDSNCPVYTTFYYVVSAYDALSESTVSNPSWAYSLVDGFLMTPAGGPVTLTVDGLTTEAYFPPGAVTQNVWVGIAVPQNYSNTAIQDSAQSTNIVREFGISPVGTKFLKPVILKMPYSNTDVANMNIENLRIYWWNTVDKAWEIVNTSDPKSEAGRVWAAVNHFSVYRVMGYVPGHEPLLSAKKVYSYPNPAKGSNLFFKYYLGNKADVTIDVFNVAGEVVAHMKQDDNPAGIVSDIEWDISKKASGVYIFRVEARAGSEVKSVTKKLAIIH